MNSFHHLLVTRMCSRCGKKFSKKAGITLAWWQQGWNYKTMHLHCLSHLVCSTLSQRPWGLAHWAANRTVCYGLFSVASTSGLRSNLDLQGRGLPSKGDVYHRWERKTEWETGMPGFYHLCKAIVLTFVCHKVFLKIFFFQIYSVRNRKKSEKLALPNV